MVNTSPVSPFIICMTCYVCVPLGYMKKHYEVVHPDQHYNWIPEDMSIEMTTSTSTQVSKEP